MLVRGVGCGGVGWKGLKPANHGQPQPTAPRVSRPDVGCHRPLAIPIAIGHHSPNPSLLLTLTFPHSPSLARYREAVEYRLAHSLLESGFTRVGEAEGGLYGGRGAGASTGDGVGHLTPPPNPSLPHPLHSLL